MALLGWIVIFLIGQVNCGNDPKCYDEVGCFPTDSPWCGPLRPLFPAPEDPKKIDTKIYCYTRDSPQRYNITLWPQILLEDCPFFVDRPTMFLTHGFAHSGEDPWLSKTKHNYLEARYNISLWPQILLEDCSFSADRPTMFLTHGFADGGEDSWLAEMTQNYLEATDANVFIVDWGKGARMLNYLLAASNTRVVGAEIARFIRYLQSEYGLRASDLHLIGHSLGAQIMSYAAKNTSGTWRLTGLDPAQPGFEGCDKTVRLDITDAEFVDLIHTNALPFLPYIGFGYVTPHGHVDFYVNGGEIQPLCKKSDLKTEITSMKDLADLSVEVMQTLFACSHNRAHKYFSDALLNNCTLWGHRGSMKSTLLKVTTGILESFRNTTVECDSDSCIPMGLDTPDYTARGIFTVNTPLVAPFCDDPETSKRISSEVSQSPVKKQKKVIGSESKAAKKLTNLSSGFSIATPSLFL